MGKLFVILLVTVAIIAIVVISVLKLVRRFFSFFLPNQSKQDNSGKKSDEVLYEKNDVIVLKGEAKSEEEKK